MGRDDRTTLVVVAGGVTPAARDGVERVVRHLRERGPGTAVLHHDLGLAAQGVVSRRLRAAGLDATSRIELAHGCVSCTLREDILPMIVLLARRADVRRIVLQLDPVVEPEQVCRALHPVQTDGTPITDLVDVRGVVSVLDVATWIDDATSDDDVADRDLARLPDDERTTAHLVVSHVEFADLVVVAGSAEPARLIRTDAVLARLAPLAPRLAVDHLDDRLLLEDLPAGARRGRPEHPHAPLLRGQPPLEADGDVRQITFTARRPFHPERLHDAIDVLLTGVVRTRGRIWLATRPADVLWLESAGGGLQVGHVGRWLAAAGEEAAGEETAGDGWADVDPERRAAAALRWHPRWGDRVQELAILLDGADPDVVDADLRSALLTDAELARGERAWQDLPDPFGSAHTDPCTDGRGGRPAVRGHEHTDDPS